MTEEFKILLDGIEIADEDAEGFDSLEMYQDFTERFLALSSDELEIEITNAEEGILTLLIDDNKLDLTYNTDDEWFDIEYISQLNKYLKDTNLTKKRFCFVEPYGVGDADQGVKIAFIDEQLFITLIEKSYANKNDNATSTHFS